MGDEKNDGRVTSFDAEAGLRAIVDHSSSAIFVKDLEGRYSMVNEAFLGPIGLDLDEVIGRTAAEIWPDAGVSDATDKRVLQTGLVETSDDVVQLPDGTHTMMTVRFPLRDFEGRIDGLAAITTDVTSRRVDEEALRERTVLLDTILEQSPDIVTAVDANGRVTAVSHASSNILGYDLSDPVHEDLEALIHPDDLALTVNAYARLLSLEDESLDVRYRVRHQDGHWVTLDTRGQSMLGEDGRVEGVVVISRDATSDLKFEEELQSALVAAEQASRAKSTFLSRMSHELRTPLNSVLGFAQLLQMEDLNVDQAQAVGHILQGGDHLLDLIDEVLDIARIESGHLDLSHEAVELDMLMVESVDLTRPSADARSVRMSLDTGSIADTLVLADRQRLLQVLLNLLSNAVKYNRPGGHVEVAAKLVQATSGERVQISVSDNGPGIASEAIGRVFDPFERLGAEHRAVEGTGVGLTLSKHLVEQMGGEITVESELGVGTTFTVFLSVAAAPDRHQTRVDPKAQRQVEDASVVVSDATDVVGSTEPLRVLHVEDNLASLDLVEQVLTKAGRIDLISASDGRHAKEMARSERPDLMLLDLHLPDVSGTDVIRDLQDDPATRSIPIVVISADAPALSAELFVGNVIARLTKPIDVHDLLRVVELVSVRSRTTP